MFELHQLRQLVAVAECGTLSAAAEQLHISQPALTRSMQNLESDLSVPLFDRKRNRVELNDAGRLAVEQARRVLDAADNMEHRMRDYVRQQTTISIGSCAPGPMWILAPEVTARFPDMTITSELREPEALLTGLLSGSYQLIVLDRPPESHGILYREYVTERLFVSLPPKHPLASRTGIWLSELAGQTMLLFSDLGIWNRLRAEKMTGIRFIVQSDRAAFYDLINASVLPSFSSNLSHYFTPPPIDRVDVPVLDPEAAITFYICAGPRGGDLLRRIARRS